MRQQLSKDLQQAVVQIKDDYPIEANQIFIENGDVYFDFEALSTLRIALAPQITSVDLSLHQIEQEQGYAVWNCALTLDDGRTISSSGYAQVGESLPNGDKIENIKSASDLSRVRAYRTALSGIGFNPIRAYIAHKKGQPVNLQPIVDDPVTQRAKDVKAIHAIATEIGYIWGNDKTAYCNLLASFYQGRQSTKELSDAEVAQFRSILTGLQQAQERRNANAS
ncbi:MAG TPA: hypothetical protein VEF04_04580 [Blastocatellia bacterium]|nr:hypothetical protein [Blastocatellia bacterium]